MNVFGAFQGDYIAAVEFNGKNPTLTIGGVKVVALEGEDGQKKGRPVVSILLRDLDEPCLSALDEFFQQVAKRLK